MPAAERLRLAALILENLTAEETEQNSKSVKPEAALTAWTLIKQQNKGGGVFKTSREADEYLEAERESWHRALNPKEIL